MSDSEDIAQLQKDLAATVAAMKAIADALKKVGHSLTVEKYVVDLLYGACLAGKLPVVDLLIRVKNRR